MKGYGLNIKKGDWDCVAAETDKDINFNGDHSALWLHIPLCKPLQ